MTTRVLHDLRVPMRDGVELALDLLRPDAGDPLPVVLLRTPYDKVRLRLGEPALPEQLAQRGYIVAFNDCRGRFNSDGTFRPFFGEADDGYDTVEWIAAQEWCDGNVGMLGRSYVGHTQWYAASRRPPHLKAIVPICATPPSLWRNEPLFGGCFQLNMAEWMVLMGARSFQTDEPLWTAQQPYFEALPLTRLAELAGVQSAWWDEWMEHPTFDSFWRAGTYDNHAEMDVAALNITGWWDSNFPAAPLNFEAMQASPAAGRQRLLIGPWPHRVNRERSLSGVDFGEQAVIALEDRIIRFYDRWLKGVRNGVDDEPPVSVFVVGANEWWSESEWPPSDACDTPFYFHSHGRANSALGDGVLSLEPPADEASDVYRYDPRDPIRTLWQIGDGPVDDRLPSLRHDCLCYTSEPLREPLDVLGWVTCRLYASSSALDTDWHVRLVDVHPDGSARFLCRGALRARFRESEEHPQLLRPNHPTRFDICMDACGVRFRAGHRIRVELTSSWFTRYDRNTNSGAENFFAADKIVVADQRVYHERGLASHVVLPVIRQPRPRRPA